MHFTAGVILPAQFTKKSAERRIQRAVEKLLFRFGEEYKLKPYIALCDCIVESTYSYKKRSPRYGKPNPKCDDCKGSGKVTTTENDNVQFDWWEIGGNWDGDLAKDAGKLSYLWRNCVAVREVPEDYDFFAIVTPNQKWHEELQFMGPKVGAKKALLLWNAYQNKLLKKYRKNLIVLVDCHA